MKLVDKVAIITGGGSGIGAATARLFAQEGAKVVVADVDEERIHRVAEEVRKGGGEALAHRADVTSREAVEGMVARTLDRFGRVDILINNAGLFRDAMSWKMGDEEWDLVLEVNLKGTFLCCRAVIPTMRAQNYGKIVNTSSIGALGNPGQANYSAAKAGVIALTKTLALELAPARINVNCVAPGSIDTPLLKGMPQDLLQRMVQERVPLRRMGLPEEVAKLHLFLTSDDAAYITGQVIFIDGGVSVGI
jgi:3-oxoacyl-[acyl-carrier protein] reductase